MFYHGNNFKKSYTLGGEGSLPRYSCFSIDAPMWFKLYRCCSYGTLLSVSCELVHCHECTVNGPLVESKMCTFTLESTHFIFNKSPIYTQDCACASVKFSTNSHQTDYIVHWSD
jgi:hypothetical protein